MAGPKPKHRDYPLSMTPKPVNRKAYPLDALPIASTIKVPKHLSYTPQDSADYKGLDKRQSKDMKDLDETSNISEAVYLHKRIFNRIDTFDKNKYYKNKINKNN